MSEQPDPDFPDLSDPAFAAKVAAYVAGDDEAHADWLARDEFGALIDGALAAGRAAHQAAVTLPEEENPRWSLVAIDLGHRRAKPLVQALAGRGLGQTEILTYTFEVSVRHVMGKRKAATSAQLDFGLFRKL